MTFDPFLVRPPLDPPIEDQEGPQPPQSLQADHFCCRTCGAHVGAFFYDDCIKKCLGPGHHIIGWNGQLSFKFEEKR